MSAYTLQLQIALAYLGSRRRQTAISVMGVAMGVGFFIAISAMMQGMQEYFVQKIIDVAPHVTMKDEYRQAPKQPIESQFSETEIALEGLKPKEELRGIRGSNRILSYLKAMPGIEAAASLQGQVILRYGGKDQSATLRGIDPDQERKVSHIERDLIAGSMNDLKTNSNGILLGESLAAKIGAQLGDKISVISPVGVSMVMKVVGIFRTGITSIDAFESYALLRKSQILQQRDNRINLIFLRLTDIDAAGRIAADLEQRFGYRTEGWQETNENVFGIFVIQNGIMYSTVAAILIVSGFGIFNIISTVVNEKVRDIAILKSMGFGRKDVERIFFLQGIVVGLVGMIIGWALGYAMVEMLATVRLDIGDKGFMRMNHFYLHRSFSQYIVSGALAVLSAAFSAYVPARKAAAVNPVDIIRGAA